MFLVHLVAMQLGMFKQGKIATIWNTKGFLVSLKCTMFQAHQRTTTTATDLQVHDCTTDQGDAEEHGTGQFEDLVVKKKNKATKKNIQKENE